LNISPDPKARGTAENLNSRAKMNPPQFLTLAQTARHLFQAMEAGEKVAVVAVIEHPETAMVGRRFLVRGEQALGSLQDPVADKAALDLARAGLSGDPGTESGLRTLPIASGGKATVYLELHHPPPEMVIVGAGHLAQPLCTLGTLLGLRVRVLDDRPEFATRERFPEAIDVRKVDFTDPFAEIKLHPWSHVLLVTRGHRYDFECLRKVLQHDPLPGYIGMIGSRRRVKATFESLLKEGFSKDRLRQVWAPIGLDLGAETPAEIAVSVAAEIVQLWRGGPGGSMREGERVLERLARPRADEPESGLEGRTEDEK
jgi:xanthine dehydrogenase accessory factor